VLDIKVENGKELEEEDDLHKLYVLNLFFISNYIKQKIEKVFMK